MFLKPGTYKARVMTDLTLKRSNSIGAHYYDPATVNYRTVRAGDTFEVPTTVGAYYYTSDAAESQIERVTA